ncbi:MAG: hypothetical protein K8W52_08090 [Deltaproteobacteria bacterium]|nr:hypothetical protein [Deltaproteobacteria bacterium]
MLVTLDLVLRFVYVVLIPGALASLALLISVTGLVVSAAIATAIALIGTERWRRKVEGIRYVGRFLGNMARLGEYYQTRPPRGLWYYVLYPLLAPYWLWKREARREFLLYRRISGLVLVIAVISGAHAYLDAWYPDIPLGRFVGAAIGGLAVQLIVTFSVIMPIVTTVIAYHQRGRTKTLAVMVTLAAVVGVGSYAVLRDYPFVRFETRERIKARTHALPERTHAALAAAIVLANRVFLQSRDGARALEAARTSLRSVYREDEALAFRLFADGSGQVVLMARFEPSAAAAWLVMDATGPLDDPQKWSAKTHEVVGR